MTAFILVAVIAGELINLIEGHHAIAKSLEIMVGAAIDKILE